jgi:predicted ATPase
VGQITPSPTRVPCHMRTRLVEGAREGKTGGMEQAAATRPMGDSRAALTSFIGRRRELSEVKSRMADSRLVTLTGPGGVGKTRLALEVADRSRRGLRDGVWSVDLASLEDESSLAQVVASALLLPDQSNRDPNEKLRDYVRDRQMLIVLDNCEHLLRACASLAESLLGEAPGLRILATSREPLGIGGEQLCAVPPLTAPPANESHSANAISHYEAVSLLVDRARNVVPDFSITEENAEAIVQLCDRLDGIPLAIELAATRLRSLSVTQIVERLDKRFSLLAGGNRWAMPRQQTLRALIDWSFDLCTKDEQVLWARLSVFPGSFDLDAVEQTCGFGPLDQDRIIDLLDRLVAKSILLTERTGESVRYRQLMTVREYGSELLDTSGELLELKSRHRDHYLTKAGVMVDRWCGPGQATALARMKADHASLLSALEWSAGSPSQIGAAAELASLLRYHWVAGGFLSDGRRWLEQILSGPLESSVQRGNALWVAAWIALMQGDRDAARRHLAECEAVAAELQDPRLSAHTTQWSGILRLFSGETQAAIDLFGKCIATHADFGNTASVLTGLFQLAMAQTYNGDLEDALQTCDRAIRLSEENGEQWNRSYSWWITGLCRWHLGDLAAARKAAVEALALIHI